MLRHIINKFQEELQNWNFTLSNLGTHQLAIGFYQPHYARLNLKLQ